MRPLSSTSAGLPGKHVLFGAEIGGDESEAYGPSHALTIPEIKDVVSQFARAASLAVSGAGFDGVEIHGGNGYLVDSFTHDSINTRGDEYGGSIANRIRFALEDVDAVASVVGRHRTAIRLAPYHVLQGTNDSSRLETFSELVGELEKRGLAYVHVVEPRYDRFSREGAFSGDMQRGEDGSEEKEDEASIWLFRRILKTTPVIGAGGYDAVSAARAIDEGRVDLVAFGRYFTSNPDLPERLFKDRPLTKYHRPTFYTSGEEGYLGWSRWEDEPKDSK